MDHFASDVIKEKFVDMLKQLKNIIQDYHNGVEREDSTLNVAKTPGDL